MLGEQEEGDDQEVELNLLGLPLPPPGPPDEPLEEHEGAPCALPHPRGATVPAQSCGPSRRSGCAAACWAWRVRPARLVAEGRGACEFGRTFRSLQDCGYLDFTLYEIPMIWFRSGVFHRG